MDNQVAALQADMKKRHTDNKVPYSLEGKLTLARVRTSGDWPKFKGKGANTRNLIVHTLALAKANNSGSAHDKRRVAVCELMDRFYVLLHEGGRWFSDEVKAGIGTIGKNFLAIYRNLAFEALHLPDRPRKWKMTQMFHLFEHLCSKQAPL